MATAVATPDPTARPAHRYGPHQPPTEAGMVMIGHPRSAVDPERETEIPMVLTRQRRRINEIAHAQAQEWPYPW